MKNNEKLASGLEQAGNTPIRQSKEIVNYLYLVTDSTPKDLHEGFGVSEDFIIDIIEGTSTFTVSQLNSFCERMGIAPSILLWLSLMHGAREEKNDQKQQVLEIIYKQLRVRYPNDDMWKIDKKEE